MTRPDYGSGVDIASGPALQDVGASDFFPRQFTLQEVADKLDAIKPEDSHCHGIIVQ